MSKLRKRAARKAAKVTARHAAHGVATKARRTPVRSAVLFWAGAGVGATVTCLVARSRPAAGGAPPV